MSAPCQRPGCGRDNDNQTHDALEITGHLNHHYQPPESLSFAMFSKINRSRVERWHPGFPDDGWTGADWSNAMCGEAGEAANIVKKLRRIETGLESKRADEQDTAELVQKLADEIGDVFTYLDLLAQFYALDIARCAADKFNAISVREGFPERMPLL